MEISQQNTHLNSTTEESIFCQTYFQRFYLLDAAGRTQVILEIAL